MHMHWNTSEQFVSWFRKTYLDGNLTIKPPYQRKPVWAAKQKCKLIETILLGLPIPEIFIQQSTTPEGDTTYAIVDGQQRIRTVLQFIGADLDPDQQESNKFVLELLPDDSKWKGLTFSMLSDEEKKDFYGYRFVVRYLNTNSDEQVRDMFRRLNQFLTPLKPQELRNAIYSGPFAQLAENLGDSEYWAENGIVGPASIRRMGDIEFISELLIGVMHGPQGGSSSVIDAYYAEYEDYEDSFPEQVRTRRLFGETLRIIQAALPEIKQTRWSNKSDFYTLFVGIATLLRTAELPGDRLQDLRDRLLGFAEEIEEWISDPTAKKRQEVIDYVRAVEKGANDKKRRAVRQKALNSVIEELFRAK